jgi:succinate dehydrogenase/fumarate reductase flavoprotein subunit
MTEDHVADVIVVGGGGSGLAAAITAAELGRGVILLEKNGFIGGSTIRSIGSISATATPHQIRKGIKDTPDEHFRDLGRFNEKLAKDGRTEDNLALRRILVDNVGDSLRWLMSIGVVFYGPLPEPPHSKPRMHNVMPNSRAYGYFLKRRARAVGVDIRTARRARRVIMDGSRAAGIECTTADGLVERYIARGGVVLTTGDYSASSELKARFGTNGDALIGPTNPTNTGDGHSMAMQTGARVINGHLLLTLVRFIAPPPRWVHGIPPWSPLTRFMAWSLENMPGPLPRPFVMSFLTTVLALSPELFRSGAILVNKRGERFTDETALPVYPLSQQPDQTAYVILDGSIGYKFSAFPHFVSTAPGIAYAYIPDYVRSRSDVARKASSLSELALKIGIDAQALERTVAARNAEAAADPQRRFPQLTQPPFYALGPMRSFVNLTDGGLAIDENFNVLGENGKPIEGLYAAGSAGQGGILLEGHGHHLGWAFTSGRLAGRNAAYRVSSADTWIDPRKDIISTLHHWQNCHSYLQCVSLKGCLIYA